MYPALGDLRGLAAMLGTLALEGCMVLGTPVAIEGSMVLGDPTGQKGSMVLGRPVVLGDPVTNFEIFGSGEQTLSSTVLDLAKQFCTFSLKQLLSDLVSCNTLCCLVLLDPELSLLDPESRRLLIFDGGLLSPTFGVTFVLFRFFGGVA